MKRTIVYLLILLGIFTVWFYTKNPLTTRVEIKGHFFTVDIAATGAEKAKGLGERDNMPQNHGMLFPYDHKEQYGFWMKGMRFPIDIIWIEDHTIVDISKNVPIATSGALPSYYPKKPVNKILELNAGTVDRLGIEIGDTAVVRN
jgi:uncharacterized protein